MKSKEEKMRTALASLYFLFTDLDAFREFALKNKENKKIISKMKKIIAEAIM